MFVRIRRIGSLIACAALLAAVAFTAGASTGPNAPSGGVTGPPETITVGGLARILVSEVALNAPRGGFDESRSLGVMGSLGYQGRRSVAEPATAADLQAMLSTLGVEASTGSPENLLSPSRVSQTLNTVRGALPRFEVPATDERSRLEGVRDDQPGSCQIARRSCIEACRQLSPSGTGSGGARCVTECQEAFHRCRRGYERRIR